MQERRRFVRCETRCPMTFTVWHQVKPTPSLTSDIGGGGIRFHADEALAPGTRLQGEVVLQDHDQPCPFTAEVIWSEESAFIGQPTPARDVELGVRFVEIAPDDQERVMRQVRMRLQPPWAVGASERVES